MVLVTPIEVKVWRITLLIHHTQLKEVTENNNRWVITRSFHPLEVRLTRTL